MKRIETARWIPSPNQPSKLEYDGQRTAQEVFEELSYRLANTGYLPEEYFLLDSEWLDGKEFPQNADIFSTTDYGGSEGIYTDVYLRIYDDGNDITRRFATGKTLGESESDLDRMNLIASAITKAFHSDGVHARYIR
ncbi:MAG: ankyrin repeat domain-containing protein, partial [Eubacteriales bacterium]|nr:ankyrin repeat domain-containing protein [Eubacteriales bacterium]